MRGSSDLKGGGSVRRRGEMLILVCVLKRNTPGEFSNDLADRKLSYQSTLCRRRLAATLVRVLTLNRIPDVILPGCIPEP